LTTCEFLVFCKSNIFNVFFYSRNTDQISNAIDETYFKLQDLSNILLPCPRRIEEPETLFSLDLSMDDAVWILQHLRKLFNISNYDEQHQLMTMLPPTWGRDRIANWFSGSRHQARQSIELRSNTGVFS
jgi:hypothetical protein